MIELSRIDSNFALEDARIVRRHITPILDSNTAH